jgi:D-3-phosphoglycerate dehydrogenase / 2-oxoglutarate reductase
MEIIALTGPYDPNIKALLYKTVPSGFKIIEIASESEYGRLQNANYIILRTLKLKEQVITSIPDLKLIQRWGVGYDSVDIQAAGKRNIPVAITSGMNAVPVSEMAVLLMLAVYRNLPGLYHNVLAGKWREGLNVGTLYTIEGKTVGLVGLGSIGKQVAKKVRAFGAEVQYYDPFRLPAEEEVKLGVHYTEFEELLKTSDIISLHVPLGEKTRHLINKETIELMKPSAILINTARGEIIKDDDLVAALASKRILGAGLDVVEHEPADKNNPLLSLDNIVVTPHMGGSTMDISINMVKRCIENIVKVSRSESLSKSDVVNAQYFLNGK